MGNSVINQRLKRLEDILGQREGIALIIITWSAEKGCYELIKNNESGRQERSDVDGDVFTFPEGFTGPTIIELMERSTPPNNIYEVNAADLRRENMVPASMPIRFRILEETAAGENPGGLTLEVLS